MLRLFYSGCNLQLTAGRQSRSFHVPFPPPSFFCLPFKPCVTNFLCRFGWNPMGVVWGYAMPPPFILIGTGFCLLPLRLNFTFCFFREPPLLYNFGATLTLYAFCTPLVLCFAWRAPPLFLGGFPESPPWFSEDLVVHPVAGSSALWHCSRPWIRPLN